METLVQRMVEAGPGHCQHWWQVVASGVCVRSGNRAGWQGDGLSPHAIPLLPAVSLLPDQLLADFVL